MTKSYYTVFMYAKERVFAGDYGIAFTMQATSAQEAERRARKCAAEHGEHSPRISQIKEGW